MFPAGLCFVEAEPELTPCRPNPTAGCCVPGWEVRVLFPLLRGGRGRQGEQAAL